MFRIGNCIQALFAFASLWTFVVQGVDRPNFVFICADDQRYDALGIVQEEQGIVARFPWLKTPNLDRFASEGVRFRNAFVTSSLCSPSRASFLTGQYNHLNGIANNHTEFPRNSVTYATVLRNAGYKTAYVGKWHMSGQTGQRPGFDFSASYTGHGRYVDCPFQVNGILKLTKGWVDKVTTDYAITFIQANRTNNFMLAIGLKSPHTPRIPADAFKTLYAGERCRPAKSQLNIAPFLGGNAVDQVEAAQSLRGPYRLDYFRCITAADQQVGRLLRSLDELGLTDRTMVIFTSDNGFCLGEHGLADKRTAYEESMRVPLLIRFPKVAPAGVVIDNPVLNIDLAPTLIDFAGRTPPAQIQGRSWRPLIEGDWEKTKTWRTSFLYEYFAERGSAVPTTVAIRTPIGKLIEYPGFPQWTQMFDLRTDTYERRNALNLTNSQSLRQTLQAELTRQINNTRFEIPEYVDDYSPGGETD